MRLAIIGDVHGERERLDHTLSLLLRSAPVDLALLSGDLGRDPPRIGRRTRRAEHDASVKHVAQRVGAVLGCPVVFVPGNHDLPDPLSEVPAINADGRIVEAAGLRIAGLGGAGPATFGFPYEWSEEQAASVLERFPAAPRIDVLLCHTPPYGTTLDRTYSGHAVGSRSVAQAIARLRPRLFACGHIHEAWGEETIEGVPCLNAGALGAPYGQVIGWIVEWDAGPRSIQVIPESLRR